MNEIHELKFEIYKLATLNIPFEIIKEFIIPYSIPNYLMSCSICKKILNPVKGMSTAWIINHNVTGHSNLNCKLCYDSMFTMNNERLDEYFNV